MCGRYAFYESWQEFLREYNIEVDHVNEFPPVYNAAPSMRLPVLYQSDAKRHIDIYRWGLIPHWSKDEQIGYKMINARGESVATKPAFRKPFASQRCLVPASGFFEWKKQGKTKQPWFIRFSESAPMWFAGLYDEWISTDSGEVIPSFTIITTEANEAMEELHDRMPAILRPDSFNPWLDPQNRNTEELTSLLQPWPDSNLTMHPVSREVGNPRNQGKELVEPMNDLFSSY